MNRAERAAIDRAWRFLCRNNGDVPWSEIVARCAGVDPALIRAEFKRRFRHNPSASAGGETSHRRDIPSASAAARVRADFIRRFRQAGAGRPAVTTQPAAVAS
jgi:hypothetical protein